jgi:GNAT superfamily N-acetyltransferase
VSYLIKIGFENMDFTRVTEMLTTAFWSPGIAIDEVLQGARHSALVVGAFDARDRQIGYARVISDNTRFAYILDVIVDESCRRQGIGQAMINAILDDQELKEVYQWLLITRDAHEVYRKVGFQVTERPGDWMEIRKPRRNPAPRAAV